MEEEDEDPGLEIRPSVSNHGRPSTDDEKRGTKTKVEKQPSPTEIHTLKVSLYLWSV